MSTDTQVICRSTVDSITQNADGSQSVREICQILQNGSEKVEAVYERITPVAIDDSLDKLPTEVHATVQALRKTRNG
jgi:hypothetical protein